MTLTTNVPTARPLQEVVRDPDAAVAVPSYDRGELKRGVVHFGVGGFHRAHQALYFDELAQGGHRGWGVVGVGLHRAEMKQVLAAQDNLFTVVERGVDGERARIVGSIVGYLYAPDEPQAVLAALTDPDTRLVTLTVTGAGYPVDAATGEFHQDDEEIAEDLHRRGEPASVFGFIVEALRRRRDAGIAPFTVLSCDNVAENGRTTAAAVCGYARECDGGLADWIEQHVAFPSSMVDRITPATSSADRDGIAARLGIDDRWPVVTEPFRQWVIEDWFSNDRPPLDTVGAQFVDDVRPFELMKTRLLNGGHCALGYFGLLLGHERGDQAMQDDDLGAFVVAMMDQVIPLLPPVAGVDLQEYRDELMTRFSNTEIADELTRLARRGSTKLASYIVPSIAKARSRGADYRLLAATVAGWIEVLARSQGDAADLAVDEPMRGALAPLVERGDVCGILNGVRGFSSISGDDEVCGAIAEALARLRERGARRALQEAVGRA